MQAGGCTWFLILGTGNLFATKQVHIKHYGLILWVPGFVDVPRLFWIQKIRKSPKWGPKFQERVFSEKKAPGRAAPHRISEWGCSNKLFYQNPNIQISRYFIYFDRLAWVHFPKIILLHGGLCGATGQEFRKSYPCKPVGV
jgi:hypothetical protein